MRRYNPKELEPKWQKIWADTKLYEVDTETVNNNFYVIPMFPYPSGDLHIGHWYNFAPTDTVARWRRMMGHNVLHTIGFDSFGLPAENAAIKRNIPPATWTKSNIESMTRQIKDIGASYDWTKTVTTSDPDYYKWTQWIFLKLYEKKLAYQAKGLVNWCPKDQTVLANEQVVGENNVCERCGTPVVKKELEQWYFKITEYTERLLNDLDNMDWPARVKLMQANWIGKSEGALIKFKIDGYNSETIKIYTTRPDTIYGATFMVIAPEHPLALKIATKSQKNSVENYISEVQRKTELERLSDDKDKSGIFTGAYAINPVNDEKLPIWVADYVMMGFGTGAIMAVPAHDERDYAFAKKHKIEIKDVIEPALGNDQRDPEFRKSIVAIVRNPKDNTYLSINWGPKLGGNLFVGGGMNEKETTENTARREIAEETGYRNLKLVSTTNRVHYQYFAYSKNQARYIHCWGLLFELIDEKRADPKPEDNEKGKFKIEWLSGGDAENLVKDEMHAYMYRKLVKDIPYTGEGLMVNSGKYDGKSSSEMREKIITELAKHNLGKESITYRLRDWLISRQRYWGAPIPIIYCDKCGTVPVPEKELPVKLPENVQFKPTGQSPLLSEDSFVNTTCPNCSGPAKRETDTMDTFVDSSWYFLRYPNPNYEKEPFKIETVKNWLPVDHYIGGIEHAILHLMYARFVTMFLHDYHGLDFEEPFKKLSNQGIILGPDGHKMSKSRGNVVNPDEQVKSYGADSLRLYLMFMGPYDQGGPYNLTGIAGTRRFLERVWKLVGEFKLEKDLKSAQNPEVAVRITRILHITIKKVSQDIEKLNFNTAISALMECINEFYKIKTEHSFKAAYETWGESLSQFIKLLAPFAPHITEELWEDLGNAGSIHIASWPMWDDSLIEEKLIKIAVQINGKVRSEILVEKDSSEVNIINTAKKDLKVAEMLKDKSIKKSLYIKGRLVSIVTD